MNDEESALLSFSFASTTTYTFLEEIGRGGMGIAYLAERDSEGVRDDVVLKILKSRSEKNTESLKREANISTCLRHENIVKTYGMESIPYSALPRGFAGDIESLSYERIRQKAKLMRRRRIVGGARPAKQTATAKKPQKTSASPQVSKDSKRLYVIAMDYIDGTDLAALHRSHIRQGLLIPCELSGFIISRMCRALEYAHEFIVHRDISPENVLINNQGVCKLSDFGIAIGAQEQTSDIAGKIQYMAPEQLRGEQVDARSDIYSLGLVAYELLTGIGLFAVRRDLPTKERVKQVLDMMDQPIPDPAKVRPSVPEKISVIVSHMIKKNPAERYQTAGKVGVDLEQKYLYASGFGPTNNSLASYIDISEKGFRGYSQNQLQQLVFLKNEAGKISFRRRISRDGYTPVGMEMIAKRPGTTIYQMLIG